METSEQYLSDAAIFVRVPPLRHVLEKIGFEIRPRGYYLTTRVIRACCVIKRVIQ